MNNLTPEEKEVGRENYYGAVTAHDEMSRRGFLQQVAATGVVSAAGAGALYFGYNKPPSPVRIGVIGTGDEGSVLIGSLNPDYVQVVHISDIRPSSVHRAFHGDHQTANTIKVRPGLMSIYDWKTEDEAKKHVKVSTDYEELLADPDVEAVIIAVPLHLHAPIAVKAMKAGKHVLTEKLMAHNVAQCKILGRVSEATQRYCATGHQRHYSILYDNAVNLIRWGVIGQVHHIRAQWHRGNLPGADSWAMPIPGGEKYKDPSSGQTVNYNKILDQLNSLKNKLKSPNLDPVDRDLIQKQVAQWIAWNEDQYVQADRYGYETNSEILSGLNRTRTALEELVRWRLWDRTGGGLMAELGSHQLDAASIIIGALSKEKGHQVHPLTVHATGGRHIFPFSRDADDHVYCMFEFPGPHYEPDFRAGYQDKVNHFPDPNKGIPSYEVDSEKKIVMTYSSINGNGFGGYGEVVLGTKGTLVLDREKEVMLYQKADTKAKVGVKTGAGGPALDTTASGDVGPAKAAESGPVSRGYTEEIEHWAWCIRTNDFQANQPRCKPEVAVADACIALTTKLAIGNARKPNGHGFIQFNPNWFDIDRDEVPEDINNDGSGPNIASEKKNLGVI